MKYYNSEECKSYSVVQKQDGVENAGLTVDSCSRVYNKKQNGQVGTMLKFTINLFHTSCLMNVNGKRVDLFINNTFDGICEKVEKEFNEIELLNQSIESYLSDENYTKVIQKSITNKEIHPENEKAYQFKDMNNSQTKNFNGQILETQYIESDKNICPGCRQYVDDGIGCDRCDFWYHYESENITSNIGNEAFKHIEYICRFCNDDMLYENRNHLECDVNEESNIYYWGSQTVNDLNSNREKDHPQNADSSKKNKDTNIDSGDTVQCTRKLISVDGNNTFNEYSKNASQPDPEEETSVKSVESPKPSKTNKKTEDSTAGQPNDKKKWMENTSTSR
ncbi:unnamed protein product [Mytilus edulis]|uniref:Uncharacterized protein n=1 Tax=Mytilus edulis TaxID=6550 RepID=A0A8S3PMQ2_MYTED|nr:unnamed protein product [Mytilus edulis]